MKQRKTSLFAALADVLSIKRYRTIAGTVAYVFQFASGIKWQVEATSLVHKQNTGRLIPAMRLIQHDPVNAEPCYALTPIQRQRTGRVLLVARKDGTRVLG